ncbi:MAG: hypothetical protein WDZ81_00100, partial [Candidatus Saccharimonadales bacterium]
KVKTKTMTTHTQTMARYALRRNREISRYKTSQRNLGPVSVSLFLVVILGVMALLYLTQITKTSVYGYSVSNLNEEKVEVLENQQELAVEAARLRSIERIKGSTVVQNMETHNEVSYVTDSGIEARALNQ